MLTVYKRFCMEVRKVVYSDVILGKEYWAMDNFQQTGYGPSIIWDGNINGATVNVGNDYHSIPGPVFP